MDGVEAEFGGRGVVGVKPAPVAAKRLKDLQQHLVDLDDLELLDRHLAVDGATGDPSAEDGGIGGATGMVAEELRQKNKDLVLAARLGKALLAKNDELSLMNERLAEEYGDKLEVRVKNDFNILVFRTGVKYIGSDIRTTSKRFWIYGYSSMFFTGK